MESGVDAKYAIEDGLVSVNGETAFQRGKKLVDGDVVAYEGNTIKIIKSKLNPKLEIEGFLLTMYDSRLRLARQVSEEVKRHFDKLVFNTMIQRNVKLSEAPSHGEPIIVYDPKSRGAEVYTELAKEVIGDE